MTRNAKQYLVVFLVVYALWIFLFQLVGRYAATLATFNPTTSLDLYIPVIPESVWIYEFCYIFPWLPLLVVRDYHRLNLAILAILLANATAFSMYLLFPIAFPRPEMGSSISEQLLAFEYAADFSPGANKLPSMHVAFAWLVYLACRGQKLNKAWEFVIGMIAMGITLSTLLVKQHIVVDVIFGVFWAFASWELAKAAYPRLTDGSAEPLAALKKMFRISGGAILYRLLSWTILPAALWGVGRQMQSLVPVDWTAQTWTAAVGIGLLGAGSLLMLLAFFSLLAGRTTRSKLLVTTGYALAWIGYSTWVHSFWMLTLGSAILAGCGAVRRRSAGNILELHVNSRRS